MSSNSSSSLSSSTKIAAKRCSILVFSVVLLPYSITFAHLFYILQRSDILLVEEIGFASIRGTPPSISIAGIYQSQSPGNRNGGSQYVRQDSFSDYSGFLLPSWPSISQVTSTLENRDNTKASSTSLAYDQETKRYCFHWNSEQRFCSQDKAAAANSNDSFFPPEYSVFKKRGDKDEVDSQLEIRIRRFDFYKHYYFQKDEKPFQQLFQRPGSSFLWVLNIGLAFVYWNYHVSPSQVALQDGPILQQHQYWRALTGTLAHFEWWHLLFNMMSLQNLGQFLEPMYGSIPFLLYNLALVPLTVIIFLGGTHFIYWYQLRQNTSGVVNRPSVNAVGYSGVLFAWMVVASLEQPNSCPIPFLTDVCFDTWHITKHIKFNVGPLIQLVIAQVILPRVSLGGHLAGIIAGFWLHWNLLPLELVQPSVLIPLVLLVQWKLRQFISIQNSTTKKDLGSTGRNLLDVSAIDDENDTESSRTTHLTSQKHWCSSPCCLRPGHDGESILYVLVYYAMMLSLVGSLAVMKWTSSLISSQILLYLMFFYCCQSYMDDAVAGGEPVRWNANSSQKNERMLVLWRGFIVSCVLVLIMDSMTMASWQLMGNAMISPFAALFARCFLVFRILINLGALSLACKQWADVGGENEERGIFEITFGVCVLPGGKLLGTKIVSLWLSSAIGHRLRRTMSHQATSLDGSTGDHGRHEASSGDKDQVKILAAAAAERRARATAANEESDVL